MKKAALLVTAVVALVVGGRAVMSDVHTAEYKGSQVCVNCHKMLTSKTVVEGYLNSSHPKALQKPDDPGAIVSDFSKNPAFKQDKVAYVLGKGDREQDYMDANYQVLPAKWDVKAKAWKPRQAADGATQCVGCHVTNYEPVKKTYTQMGVGCESCHGPGGDHTSTMNKAKIVNPKNLDMANRNMVCGQCHSAGKDISGKYAFPVGFRPSDDLTKFFVDAKPTAPGMNQEYSEFITSKHASNGLGCTTCHNPHGATANPHMLVKPINDLCLGCHAAKIKDMKTHAPNAAADATCATCHMENGVHTFKKPVK